MDHPANRRSRVSSINSEADNRKRARRSRQALVAPTLMRGDTSAHRLLVPPGRFDPLSVNWGQPAHWTIKVRQQRLVRLALLDQDL